MKVVIDTNEIFSFFNVHSKARELSLIPNLDLHSPSFSLKEIEKHKSKILKNFSLVESQYLLVLKLLKIVIKFVEESKYSEFLSEAEEISPDPNDVDFFALALKLNCPIWSGDKKLKGQSRVKILETKELEDRL
jgi:predicted nucleic acid-binding protein